MSEPTSSPARDEIVLRLFDLFRRAGYEGVSLGEISTATGLGRSSLYHYFPGGKADMAGAVVAFARRWIESRLVEPLRASGPLHDKIEMMIAAARELYEDGSAPCLVASMLIGHDRSLGESVDVGALLTMWIDALAEALEQTGVAPQAAHERATWAVAGIEGALIVARATGRLAVFEAALQRVRRELAPAD